MTSPQEIVFYLILFYFVCPNLLYLVLWVGALRDSRLFINRSTHTNFDRLVSSPLTIPISVVIPAYNEELGVVDLVHSALNSAHPEFEVILVDDGSTDGTIALLRKEFDLQLTDPFYPAPLPSARILRVYRSLRWPMLSVIEKENGGKADAINAGVNLARFRFIMLTDADTLLHPEALLRASNVLNQDPSCIVGLAGQVRVKNGLTVERGQVTGKSLPRSIVARFQLMEYAATFVGNRVGWNILNATPIVSGAFAIWRRDVLIRLGGMTSDTTHEDLEFTMRVHADQRESGERYGILCQSDLIVWTEVPERWSDLYRQRKRWQRVLYEVVYRYRRLLFNPRYGSVGMLTMPYMLIFEALGPWIELASYGIVVWYLASGWLDSTLLVLFLVASFGLSALLRILSLLLDFVLYRSYSPAGILKLAGLALLENVVYRPVTLVARVHAFFEFVRKRKTWERVQRLDVYRGVAP